MHGNAIPQYCSLAIKLENRSIVDLFKPRQFEVINANCYAPVLTSLIFMGHHNVTESQAHYPTTPGTPPCDHCEWISGTTSLVASEQGRKGLL